jgi:AbrB family looped-hinge helix DNA binding protein
MTRKTLTISREAYNTLARIKRKNESFSEVILRITGKKTKGNLLEYIRSIAPDNELADSIEKVLKKRNNIHLRTARLNTVQNKQLTNTSRSMDRLRQSSKTPGWSGAREIRKWRDNTTEVSKWKITVTPKGQIKIPVEVRKKYGIREGTKIRIHEAPAGLMLRPIPKMEDLAGVDVGKRSYAEVVEKLDNLRKRWR